MGSDDGKNKLNEVYDLKVLVYQYNLTIRYDFRMYEYGLVESGLFIFYENTILKYDGRFKDILKKFSNLR